MAYDAMFSSSNGFVSGRVYYAQLVGFTSGLFWDSNAGAMATAPSFANTVLTVNEPNSWGVFGILLPTALPAGVYRLLFRQRDGGSAAASDNIIHDERMEKLISGAPSSGRVRFASMDILHE